MPKTKNFADVLRRQIASDASLASAVQRERTRLRISQLILGFREQLKAYSLSRACCLSIGESISVAFRSAKVAPLSRSERRQCDS